jgi:mannitol-specific phosphotransferase system IIBC component
MSVADIIRLYLGWPQGEIWPNILSDLVSVAPGFVISHLLLRRHQSKKTDQQTDEIKEHITSTLQGPPT